MKKEVRCVHDVKQKIRLKINIFEKYGKTFETIQKLIQNIIQTKLLTKKDEEWSIQPQIVFESFYISSFVDKKFQEKV